MKPLSVHKILSSCTNPLPYGQTPTLEEIQNINLFSFYRHLSNHFVYCQIADKFNREPMCTPIENQYRLLSILSKTYGKVRYIIGKKKDKEQQKIIDDIIKYYKVNHEYALNILQRYQDPKVDKNIYKQFLEKIKSEGEV